MLTIIFGVTVALNLFLVPFATAQQEKAEQQKESEEQARKALELETMTVTARKKEENVQDVPMSISVFSDIQLEDAGIGNIFELTRFTPNMFMKNTFENEVIIRGICAPRGSLYGPAGFYVDDVSYSIPQMRNPALFDIERIEVLKGPQGTLYGRNSESGVINIITKQPDNQLRGKVFGEYGYYDTPHGNIDSYRAGGNISGPVVRDKLYLGLAGQWEDSDGYMINVFDDDEKAAEIDRKNGRAILRWTPSDRWDISFTGDYMHTNDGQGYVKFFDGPNKTDRYEIAWDGTNFWDQESSGQALRLRYEAGGFDVLSVTTRRKWEADFGSDFDLSTLPFGDMIMNYDDHILSQELRVSSHKESTPFEWLLGLYGFKEDTDVKFDMAPMMQFRDTEVENKGYAVFGQGTYTFFERLHLTAGLRYDYLEIQGEQKFTNMGVENKFKDDEDYSELLPKASVAFDITNGIMAYASVAQGYLAGGYNYAYVTSNDNFAYDPEYTWNYEAGIKTAWLDKKLIINAAVFYIDIKDKQVIEWLPGGAMFDRDITNAGEAHSSGIELEVLARPVQGLDLFAGFGYNKAEFDDWTTVEADGSTFDFKGKDLPFAPNYTYNAGVQYRHDTGLFGRVDVAFVDDFFSDTKNESKIDSYTLVNLRLGYETERFDIVFWGKNIFDKEYASNGGQIGSQFMGLDGEPRMIGTTLTYRF
jgi:iron complex outermembrane receptor protein